LQLPKPTKSHGFCHKCWGHWDTDTKPQLYNFKRHVNFRCTGTLDLQVLGQAEDQINESVVTEQNLRPNRQQPQRKRSIESEDIEIDEPEVVQKKLREQNFICDLCKLNLKKKDKLDAHPCTVLKPKSQKELKKFVDYKLKKCEVYEIARIIKNETELTQQTLLYQEKVAVPEEYPPLFVPLKWRRFPYFNRYGSTKGTNFLVKVLREKVKLGLENSILLDGYIRVIDPDSEKVLYFLTPEILAPTDGKEFSVELVENK